MVLFASDNVTSACPEVLNAVVEANSGDAVSYGEDEWSQRLRSRFAEVFETAVSVFPVVTGTASNALALAALTPPYGKIYCHALSHINTDECGAPEFFTGGAKLIPLEGRDGKFSAQDVDQAIRGAGNVHAAQPACVSITQASEAGTVYQPEEIAAIAEAAHAHGLAVHMDGARFTNALVALDASPAEMTWQVGIDVLSFGGTKNGCLAAEAVVFFKPELAETMPFRHKRAGQLLSKMRFISAQLEAYLTDDLWLRNARHANAMAKRLREGLARIDGMGLPFPTQSNEVFAHLPRPAIDRLKAEGFGVSEEELDGAAPPRFVTAWNTKPEDIDRLIRVLAKP